MMHVFTPVGKSAIISPRRMIKPEIGLFTKMTWRWDRNDKRKRDKDDQRWLTMLGPERFL